MGNSHSGDSLNLDSLCAGLQEGRFKNVVVMCGAGISTSAGVPRLQVPLGRPLLQAAQVQPALPGGHLRGVLLPARPRPLLQSSEGDLPPAAVPHHHAQVLQTVGQEGSAEAGVHAEHRRLGVPGGVGRGEGGGGARNVSKELLRIV